MKLFSLASIKIDNQKSLISPEDKNLVDVAENQYPSTLPVFWLLLAN